MRHLLKTKLLCGILTGWVYFFVQDHASATEPNRASVAALSELGDYYLRCTETWCNMSPYFPAAFTGHWVLSKDESWTIGSFGELLHFSNGGWSVENLTLKPSMSSIERLVFLWGNSSSDGWALGDRGSIYHSNGKKSTDGYFTRVYSIDSKAEWKGIWGQGQQVWALSLNCDTSDRMAPCHSELHHFDGKYWNVQLFPEDGPMDVWGSSPSDLWLVSGEMTKIVHHFDGRDWSPIELPGYHQLLQVWGSGPNDVFVMGRFVLYNFDGKQWSEIVRQDGKVESICCYKRLIGFGKNDMWITLGGPLESIVPRLGLHWDGKQLTEGHMPEMSLPGLHVAKLDSAPRRYFDRATNADITAVTGSDPNQTWMVTGHGSVLHYDGNGFQEKKISEGGLGAIAGHGKELWALGHHLSGEDGAIFYFDGKTWSKNVAAPLFDQRRKQWNILNALWVSETKQIWAVGQENTILRSQNGIDWNVVAVPSVKHRDTEEFTAVWGSSDQDIWIVSRQGSILHWDGNTITWVKMEKLVPNLHRFSGDHFMTEHWNANSQTWETRTHVKQSEDMSHGLNAISGTGPHNIWAVGEYGKVVHFDGVRWSKVQLSEIRKEKSSVRLHGVWVRNQQAWMVGDQGQIWAWDGKVLKPQASGTQRSLYGISGLPSGGVWAVGEKGTLVKLREDKL